MSSTKDQKSTFKARVVRGGFFLTLRQLLSAALSLVSILVIARILGPTNYGIVAISLGIFYFLSWTSKLGLHVYLVRQPHLPIDAPSQVVTIYSIIGIVLGIFLWLGAPLFGWWTDQPEITQIIRWLPLPLLLYMLGGVSLSMLERDLHFDRVGLVETIAQSVNYLLAVPLVLLGWSYWGPIAGLIFQCVIYFLLARKFYPIPWQWRCQKEFIQPALKYSLTYCSSDWILSLRNLTVPLFVSRLVGIEAAGLASVTIRFVDQLSLLRLVIRRMSISVLAKLLGKPEEIRNAISRGMGYQALVIGPICAVFSCFAGWLIPLMFGAKWLPSVKVFPLVAFATMVSAIFDLHASTLYAAGHNREVARLNVFYVGTLWLASLLLLPFLHLWGYGLAEIVALPSYFLIHLSLRKLWGTPNYSVAFWLILATIPPLFAGPWVPIPFNFGVLVISYGLLFVCVSSVRETLLDLFFLLRKRRS